MFKFITADLHLGETRMDIFQRPFKNAQEQNEHLINNFNSVVKPNDELLIVGDIVSNQTDSSQQKWLTTIKQFNGRKTLIRGNHDTNLTDHDLEPYFENIIAEGEGLDLTIDNIPCYITHYPNCSKIRKFNLVGHIHSAWKFQLNALNVGVDVHHFRPVPIEKIAFFYNAICQHYDEDFWFAYHESQESYHGLRGRCGNYWWFANENQKKDK